MCSYCGYDEEPNQSEESEEPDFDAEHEAAMLHDSDLRASGFIARHDPEAMEQMIVEDQRKVLAAVLRRAEEFICDVIEGRDWEGSTGREILLELVEVAKKVA